MIRFVFFAAVALFATPVLAQDSKQQSCEYQAQVVGAIQQARLDRVKERDVQDHIVAQNPEWPDQYNNAIPLITPWVYQQKRLVLRNESLSEAWSELCLQQ